MAIEEWPPHAATTEHAAEQQQGLDAVLRTHLTREEQHLRAWLAQQEDFLDDQQRALEILLASVIGEAFQKEEPKEGCSENLHHAVGDSCQKEYANQCSDDLVELPGLVSTTWANPAPRSDLRSWAGHTMPSDDMEEYVLGDDLVHVDAIARPANAHHMRHISSDSNGALPMSLKSALHCHASQVNHWLEQWALKRERASREAHSRMQILCKSLRNCAWATRAKEADTGGDRGSTPDSSPIMKDHWLPPKEEGSLARRCFLLFERSESFILGRVISYFLLTTIVTSTISFVMESMPTFQKRPDECANLKAEGKPLSVRACQPVPDDAFEVLEAICIVIFTAEYVIRLGTSFTEPDLGSEACVRVFRYAKKTMNVIDLAAIAPFYLGYCFGEDAVETVRLLRLMRVMRLLKLGKSNAGIQLCVEAVTSSGLPLAILWFANLIMNIMFASLIFVLEGRTFSVDSKFTNSTVGSDGKSIPPRFPTGVFVRPSIHGNDWHETPFRSIPVSLWWVFTTTTTVGYGDLAPVTLLGQVVGVVCFYVGIIFLALPIGVLSSSFESAYRRYRERKEKAGRLPEGHAQSKGDRVIRPGCYNVVFDSEASLGQRIFRMLSDPTTSIWAKVTSYMIMCIICCTTITLVLESMPEFSETHSSCTPDNLTVDNCRPRPAEAFFYIEYVCIIIFTVDYVLRVATAHTIPTLELGVQRDDDERQISPLRCTLRYCLQWLNIVDFLAIMPFWVERIGVPIDSSASAVLRVLRLIRVFRLLRSPKMRTMVDMVIDIVKDAMPGLFSVFSLTSLVCVLFSACMYFAESSDYSVEHFREEHPYGVFIRPSADGYGVEVSPFTSIPSAFWWFFATATTVGYGDAYPTTTTGRIVAVLAFYMGIVLVAIKLTIIGNSFQQRYSSWVSITASDGDGDGDVQEISLVRTGSSASTHR